ncbi:MAG: nucleoside hydrolase [Thermoproteota archaeon]|nr:nucleoside hydrolase [Thermoproteota archaeon]
MPARVLMDVDTGIDDAIAIMMALQSPEIEIVGITTVSGNVTARAAGHNTLAILRAMDKDSKIPVLQGSSRPISDKIVRAKDVHGKKGLGNMILESNPSLLQKGKVSQFISRILANYRKNEVSLIATGPLTNIARVILEDAGNIDSLSRLCIMGGAYGLASKIYGNITPYAEFNFYCDPKAAQIVLGYPSDKAVRLNVVGLDVTDNYLIIDGKFVSRLSDLQCMKRKAALGYSNKVPIIAKSLLEYPLAKFGKFNLPDIFAVAMLESPDLFKFKRGKINIVQNGRLRGHSTLVVEENSKDNIEKGRKIFVASKIIDRERFHKYVFSRICDGRGL